MECSLDQIMELRFEGEEINVFVRMLDTLKDNYKKTGYKKTFKNKDEQDMLEALHYNLVSKDEENNN
jgi:hypothetical protein